MNPLALLLHSWRLRRIRWAFATLNRRLTAYEAAYGLVAVTLTGEAAVSAGQASMRLAELLNKLRNTGGTT